MQGEPPAPAPAASPAAKKAKAAAPAGAKKRVNNLKTQFITLLKTAPLDKLKELFNELFGKGASNKNKEELATGIQPRIKLWKPSDQIIVERHVGKEVFDALTAAFNADKQKKATAAAKRRAEAPLDDARERPPQPGVGAAFEVDQRLQAVAAAAAELDEPGARVPPLPTPPAKPMRQGEPIRLHSGAARKDQVTRVRDFLRRRKRPVVELLQSKHAPRNAALDEEKLLSQLADNIVDCEEGAAEALLEVAGGSKVKEALIDELSSLADRAQLEKKTKAKLAQLLIDGHVPPPKVRAAAAAAGSVVGGPGGPPLSQHNADGVGEGVSAAAPQRPPSAYIQYFVDQRAVIGAALQAQLGRKPTPQEIAREAGRLWRDQNPRGGAGAGAGAGAAGNGGGAGGVDDSKVKLQWFQDACDLRDCVRILRLVVDGEQHVKSLRAAMQGVLRLHTERPQCVRFDSVTFPDIAPFIAETFTGFASLCTTKWSPGDNGRFIEIMLKRDIPLATWDLILRIVFD